nr:hypothetical protein [Candidatus Phycosocius spiralis]
MEFLISIPIKAIIPIVAVKLKELPVMPRRPLRQIGPRNNARHYQSRFKLAKLKHKPDHIAQSLWASMHGLCALIIARPHFPWGAMVR